MTLLVFCPLALLALGGGFGVFRFNSMARATMSLLASFMATGGLLIELQASYLGVVVILMMVMEMAIMAVFMIAYMMNPAGLMPMAMLHNKRASLVISIGTFLALAVGIAVAPWPVRRSAHLPAHPTYQLGAALMGGHMLTMVVLGFVLLATMIAAVVLATDRGRYDRFGPELRSRRAADPVRGGVGR